ncbi:MAG TPA: hypothetical protein VLX56_00965 [Nitrososphaerales archaeon]|nr:hypothetical protein [Nitrososphaerales archaeon]
MLEDSLPKRSIEAICALQDADGGLLATPLDDAYPFVYPRDASFMAMALNMHGLYDRSKSFFSFLSKVRRPNGEVYQRYNKGYPFVSQEGEADVTPIVIQGIYDTYAASNDLSFLERSWEMVARGAAFVLSNINGQSGLVHTMRSIHETRILEEGFELWANCASVKGLLDASRAASALGREEVAETWLAHGKALWDRAQERLFDPDKGLFIKNLRKDGARVTAPDVSLLAPFYFGLSNDGTTLRRTIRHLKKTLWNEEVGGLNRFRDFEIVDDWHWYTGGTEASWPLFTLWLARLCRRAGDPDTADECLDFVMRSANQDGDLPEKVAPMRGYTEWKDHETGYNERVINGVAKAEKSSTSIPGYIPWACPLGWSHAEYLMLDRKDNSPEERDLLESASQVSKGQ